MDFKNRHPLNAIDGYENLSMLEALIPFVDYPLKLPLALFIKLGEIQLIMKCFQTPNNLSRLGLHCTVKDPLDMICSFTGISPELAKMLFFMMNNSTDSMFSDILKNVSGDEYVNTSTAYNMPSDNPSDSGFPPESVANMMNMVQTVQEGFQQINQNPLKTPSDTKHFDYNSDSNSSYTPNDEFSHFTPTPHLDNDFEQKIQNLFAEYDLAQAAEYDNTLPNDF